MCSHQLDFASRREGSIQTEDACIAAHGLWIPVVFGWMIHGYPDERDTWAGMDMQMESNTEILK